MRQKDSFSGYHPLVNFLYFALVLTITMFAAHPVILVLSLACALCYLAALKGKKAGRFSLAGLLPMALVAAIVNPAFNHEGATILTYLPTGNPLTLESICYGLSAAVLLCAALTWFSCLTEVFSSDQFLYLFGRVIPALSLVLSMVLRFVPKFKGQFQAVTEAQCCVGRDITKGPLLQRLRNGITIFSILVTWSLENAIETADSMKSRGYGLPGRTAFSIYRFEDRDKAMMVWLGFCGFYLACGWAAGAFDWRWYPTIRGGPVTPMTISFFLIFLALCLTPVVLGRREDAVWKHLNSKG